MLKLQIPKNRMSYLMKQVQQLYDAVILERGWNYYHKGQVTSVQLKGITIEALVKGTQTYEVVIDLEHFPNSECSCPHEGLCKHIAAAFFYLYTPYGRPEMLLQQLKHAILTRRKSKGAPPTPSEKKTVIPAKPNENELPQEWNRFFDGKFHGFSISHQHSIETFYESALATLPAYADDWKSSREKLYRLHIILFIMRKIEQFYQDTKSSYLSYYHESGCKAAAENSLEKLVQVLEEIDPNTTFDADSDHWLTTLEMLGDMSLHGKDSPINWLFVYRCLWWGITGKSAWNKKEKQRLEMLLDKKDLLNRRRDILTIARAHFDVMEGKMDTALERLAALHTRHAADFFIYLKHDDQLEQWEDMLVWLRWLLPSIPKATHEDFRTFCQYWMDAAKHVDSDAEWVQVMESLLPRSYYYYTAYLLQTHRYKQWVDLQMANRISPLSLYALELRAIEEHDPGLLLPLYHQAAERAILEKNRASYKTAVRLLKKLNGYYKWLKLEDRWEQYIYRLSDKFSRLRAFQEELKKGKWIR
ncbi:SWIM zinc finger family protein [Paenibacillus sp. GP183]|uniref:SWIM zinc finger family protein n=1 Tax=Paenibacillus sp. GP183 TaxID=1882751 RepID=UPI00089A7832|nr:SWIM zinc finger family protein [Paenibacillus sp. GP183]SEC23330.1 SWIM zinc finger [Paenibacillus sp. GP183]